MLLTAQPLVNTLSDKKLDDIRERLDERGICAVSDQDRWIELWADNHIAQYELLGGDRKVWELDLPRSTHADVNAAILNYWHYCRGHIPDTALQHIVWDVIQQPLTKLAATIEAVWINREQWAKLKPKTIKAFVEEQYWLGKVSDVHMDGWEACWQNLCTAYNRTKQTQDNTRKIAKYQLVCSIKPMAFLGLGHYKCDSGSCFSASGCHATSPVIIGGGSDSVVWFLKDPDGKTIARGWGTYTESGGYIQNMYTTGQDKRAIVRAIEQALGVTMDSRTPSCPAGVYDNGDPYAWGSKAVYVGGEVSEAGIVCVEVCTHCGEPCDTVAFHNQNGEPIGHCCEDNYSWDDCADGYIYADEAVYVAESGITTHRHNPDLYQSREGTYFLVD